MEEEIRERQLEDRDEIEHAATMEEYSEQQHDNKEDDILGGTDGTERVTHENIGGKPARSRIIFLGAWQTDGGRGRQ